MCSSSKSKWNETMKRLDYDKTMEMCYHLVKREEKHRMWRYVSHGGKMFRDTIWSIFENEFFRLDWRREKQVKIWSIKENFIITILLIKPLKITNFIPGRIICFPFVWLQNHRFFSKSIPSPHFLLLYTRWPNRSMSISCFVV